MKHLMRYEGYSSPQRLDDILDKISKYGINSMRDDEQEFLNAYKSGNQEEIHDKMKYSENEVIFEDDSGYFKFEYESKEVGDEIHYIGTLYVPDLVFTNNKIIEGRLEGKIVVYKDGQISPDFYHNTNSISYDIFEFCNGIEYELDSFLDYVVAELEEKTN